MHNLKDLRKNLETFKKKFKDRNLDFDIDEFKKKIQNRNINFDVEKLKNLDVKNRELIQKKELENQKKQVY